MRLLRKYISNVSALQFIQLLRFSVLFLISIVFVRYFNKSEIGEYEILLFVASALSFFWLRGILQSFLALLEPEEKTKKSNCYFNGFLLLFVFSLLAILFLIIFKHSIQVHLISNTAIPYFKWLLLYILFSTPSFFIEYIYLGTNQPGKIFIYGMVSYGLQFVALVVPTMLGYDMQIAIVGLVIVNAARFVFLLFVLKKYSEFTISPSFIKKHFKLAYPLIGSSLLSGSSQYIDGAIITRFFDTATFAVFRYGAREFPLVVILANALSHAMIPEFSRLSYKEALKKLKANSLKLMHILFPATIVLLFASNWLFTYFFTDQFIESAKVFNVYLLLIVLRLIFPETVLIGSRYTKVFLYTSLIEIILNVSLSILFVIKFGLIGVAFATILANLFERVALIIIIKNKYKTQVAEYVPIKCYTIYSLVTIVVYYLVDFVIFT